MLLCRRGFSVAGIGLIERKLDILEKLANDPDAQNGGAFLFDKCVVLDVPDAVQHGDKSEEKEPTGGIVHEHVSRLDYSVRQVRLHQ